jgi:hypothetical protein
LSKREKPPKPKLLREIPSLLSSNIFSSPPIVSAIGPAHRSSNGSTRGRRPWSTRTFPPGLQTGKRIPARSSSWSTPPNTNPPGRGSGLWGPPSKPAIPASRRSFTRQPSAKGRGFPFGWITWPTSAAGLGIFSRTGPVMRMTFSCRNSGAAGRAGGRGTASGRIPSPTRQHWRKPLPRFKRPLLFPRANTSSWPASILT